MLIMRLLQAKPTRRVDSATTREGTSSSLSLSSASASREYRSATSEDNVRRAMEALTLSERRDVEVLTSFPLSLSVSAIESGVCAAVLTLGVL